MRRLVVGNWKMNGSLARNEQLLGELVSALRGAKAGAAAVCVPFPYLAQAKALLAGSGVDWGAQDVSAHPPGPYTGEVCADMLREFGCAYAIVGHSERRHGLGEDSELVAAKARAAMDGGVTPIVCVGETLAEREAGRTEAVVLAQVQPVLERLGARAGAAVYAYEPVWAIGTGRNATPEQAQSVHALLREALTGAGATRETRILYGGSVKSDNAKALFAQADIDGGLIGGASLVAKDFLAICAA